MTTTSSLSAPTFRTPSPRVRIYTDFSRSLYNLFRSDFKSIYYIKIRMPVFFVSFFFSNRFEVDIIYK